MKRCSVARAPRRRCAVGYIAEGLLKSDLYSSDQAVAATIYMNSGGQGLAGNPLECLKCTGNGPTGLNRPGGMKYPDRTGS